MSDKTDAFIDWDEESQWSRQASIRAQDAKFQHAVRCAHPQFAPPPVAKPKRVRDMISITAFPRPLTESDAKWKHIVAEVADKHGLTVYEILSHRRQIPLILARHEAMYRLTKETTLTLGEIGMRLSRDHTTVLWGARKHAERMAAL